MAGSNVSGNIISMYQNSAAATFGRAAIVVLMLFSYPLQAHPCRGSLDKIFAWRPWQSDRLSASQILTPSKSGLAQMPYLLPQPIASGSSDSHRDPRFALLTALILICSYIVAMTVSSLDRVLAFVGSTGSTAISFILPGIFYHRMTRPDGLLPRTPEDGGKDDDDDEDDDTASTISSSQVSSSIDGDTAVQERRAKRKEIRRGSAVGLVIYGLIIMVVCLTVNIVVGRGGSAH
jgi:amino acid permease